jgi:hypothetical protein
MASPRDVSHPIVRTYLKKTRSASGSTVFHARISSPEHDLDRRGTGRTPKSATKRALAGLPRPR